MFIGQAVDMDDASFIAFLLMPSHAEPHVVIGVIDPGSFFTSRRLARGLS
jgi:hypothetical protein